MAWGTIRRATTEDHERLTATAIRFIASHPDLRNVAETPLEIGCVLDDSVQHDSPIRMEDARYLRRLWRRNVTTALGAGAEGIAYDYVGYYQT